jgi:glycine/D-amino acid oxidase-like deaminating enzyme
VRRDPDVIIVGGGIVGLCCAYYLCSNGAAMAVVEHCSIGAPSCSSGNTGFVGTQGAAPLAEPGVLAKGWHRPAELARCRSRSPRPAGCGTSRPTGRGSPRWHG